MRLTSVSISRFSTIRLSIPFSQLAMASGKRATKPSKDKARQFYDRRRAGIDRKVRSLITGESNEFGVAVNVTIIYEYRNEVSFFRSHLDETNARWFSSLNELVSAQCTLINAY